MSAMLFDLRQVNRSFRRQPAFFVVVTLTLAVGFAAHWVGFTVFDRMLLASPAHVQEADRIVRLHIDRDDRGTRFLWYQTPYRSYLDLREAMGPFDAMAAYRPSTSSAGYGSDARQIAITYADQHYFPLLGASARLGRVFAADDNRPPTGNPVLVLSDSYWRASFAADPAVLGRTIRVGAITYTVIGVMPRGFVGDAPQPVDAWAPLMTGSHELPATWTTSVLYRSVSVLGRLAPGVSRSTASDQVATTYRRLVEGTEAADVSALAVLASLNPGRAQRGELNQSGRIALWLECVSLLVLLVALANVVNLQMSRAAQQRRELAVRVALGAGRMRIASHVLIETLAICLLAATVAGLLTFWTATPLQQQLLPDVPGGLDPMRFGGIVILTIVGAAIICALASSLTLRMEAVAERMKTGRGGDGFSRARLRQGLLIGQVVMSVLLLVGAGLFLKSIDELGRLQFGHDKDRVLAITIAMRGAGYTPEAIEGFYDRALRELPSVPGIEAVAAAQTTPFAPSQSANLFLPGKERLPVERQQHPTFYTVTPSFFQTMGMSILRGRGFTDEDRSGAPPVLVLEDALARALFPGEDAIGRCVIVGTPTSPCRTVVGISTNTRRFVTVATGALRYYVPMAQRVFTATPQALFVRAEADPVALMPSVRSGLLRIDSNLPYARMRTLREMAEPDMRPWRLGSTLFVVFGAAALLVATMGVYALLSFMVTQRSREIGVRLALGASPAATLRLVLRQSLGWVVIGLVAGTCIALAAGRLVRPLLFETSPYDPVVFAGSAAVLALVAVTASLAPAVRASRIDPNITLRAE